MKKLLAYALLGMVSWALVGVPAEAAVVSKPGIILAKKHKRHYKKHKLKHRK